MSDIPKARKMLTDLARCAEADGHAEYARVIQEILPLLWRDRHRLKRAAAHSARSTPILKAQIRKYVDKNPNVPLQQVAIHFCVNLGRVSEALVDA